MAVTVFYILAFVVYAGLADRIKLSPKAYLLIILNIVLAAMSYFLFISKPITGFINMIDPKKTTINDTWMGRFLLKSGVKVKLAAFFTFVLIVLIAVISFIFIVKQKNTIIKQTRDFCSYAAEEVSHKVHQYLTDPNLNISTIEQDMQINMERYFQSIMLNGFHLAEVSINWSKINFNKAFVLASKKRDVTVKSLPSDYEKSILTNNSKKTSIYYMLRVVTLKSELFNARKRAAVFKRSYETSVDDASKTFNLNSLNETKAKIKSYRAELAKLESKVISLMQDEEEKLNKKFFMFRYPVVVSGRVKNPILTEFEEAKKKEFYDKLEEQIEKIKKIYFDDNGRVKPQFRSYWVFLNIQNSYKRQNEYLYYKAFNSKAPAFLIEKAKKKYDEGLDKIIKKLVEEKIRKESVSEFVPESKFVGLVTLSFIKKELYAPIWQAVNFVLTSAFIILIIGILVIVYIAVRITRPIKNLVNGVHEIKEGNLNFTIALKSKDEFGFLTSEFNEMVFSLKENKEMQKFISKETVNMIKSTAKTDNEVNLGGARKEVCFLFSDIRGFTSMSESKDPETVVSIVNTYLDMQTVIIEDCHGDIDKYVGDEIMARFTGDDKINNAIKAAYTIQEELVKLNLSREKNGEHVVEVGIGINVGDVVVGSMGSRKRMDYTAIGDAVNLAARLCSAAEGGYVLMTKTVYDRSTLDKTSFLEKEAIKVKGKAKPIQIYEIPKPNIIERG
jgi:class 3 adenylate cyclase/HAMP domain-containing protein